MEAETKSPVVLLAGIMSGIAVSLLCITVALLLEGRSLRSQLANSASETAQLRAQQSSTDTELAAHRRQFEAVQEELERLRLSEGQVAAAPDTRGQALRARVYVGNRLAGLGWVMVPPPGQMAGTANPGALANVVLDTQLPGSESGSPAETSDGTTAPGPSHPYQYAYSTPNYWPGYLLTSGWVDWPWCTNNRPADPNVPPFSPPPSVNPPATPTPAPPSPAPVLASSLRSPSLRPFTRDRIPTRIAVNRPAPMPAPAVTRNVPAAMPAVRTVRQPVSRPPAATPTANRLQAAPSTSAVMRR